MTVKDFVSQFFIPYSDPWFAEELNVRWEQQLTIGLASLNRLSASEKESLSSQQGEDAVKRAAFFQECGWKVWGSGLGYLLTFLPAADVLSMGRVCSYMVTESQSNQVWEPMCRSLIDRNTIKQDIAQASKLGRFGHRFWFITFIRNRVKQAVCAKIAFGGALLPGRVGGVAGYVVQGSLNDPNSPASNPASVNQRDSYGHYLDVKFDSSKGGFSPAYRIPGDRRSKLPVILRDTVFSHVCHFRPFHRDKSLIPYSPQRKMVKRTGGYTYEPSPTPYKAYLPKGTYRVFVLAGDTDFPSVCDLYVNHINVFGPEDRAKKIGCRAGVVTASTITEPDGRHYIQLSQFPTGNRQVAPILDKKDCTRLYSCSITDVRLINKWPFSSDITHGFQLNDEKTRPETYVGLHVDENGIVHCEDVAAFRQKNLTDRSLKGTSNKLLREILDRKTKTLPWTDQQF